MIRRIVEFSAKNRVLVILAVAAAVLYALHVLTRIRLDAIPDLSDTQVIILSRWDRSPDILEDQVTYPIVSALLGAPKVRDIRGFSDFGFSFVYVIFEDGTDIYWARSRVVEYLAKIQGQLPSGVRTEIGPDATGVGWVFQYALVDRSGTHDLADLRTYQDWYLRYALQSVEGVAEVASIGGFQKQYQVTVDPFRLQGYGISVLEVAEAVRKSSGEVGGRLIEWSGKEYMVRGRGYVKSPKDLESVVLRTSAGGTPVLLRDVARVEFGPQIRRGVLDLDGAGETVGGIVIMRHGENALNVIERVKERLRDLKASLPEGVEVLTTYDRSGLIRDAIGTLTGELVLQMAVVSLVILLFLRHFPSAIVPIITIPVSVLLAFIPMYYMGITSNIMSLSGIAISIGVLVDGAIVEVENAYKKMETWRGGTDEDHLALRIEALKEVAPSVFFSVLVIAVSFLPVFALVGQEGRLFHPLAATKTLTMILAALLAVTLDPAVRMLFTRVRPFSFPSPMLSRAVNGLLVGTYRKEEEQTLSRLLHRLYEGPCRWTLDHPWTVLAAASLLVLTTIPAYFSLGREFMPPLNEGTILYMPTTLPGISVTEASRLLQVQDRILKEFPEVVTVFGKAGRAETSTDPAPFSMMETTVVLKPPGEWREKPRWYSSWMPDLLKAPLRLVWPDRIGWEELIEEMDRAIQIPGNTNAWTMPIKGRIDMITTGIRTPVGVKILGSDAKVIERLGEEVERALRGVPGTRSVFSERAAGGYFVDITPRREDLARYGIPLEDLQAVISTALGGESLATVVEGRERYSVNLRYPRDLRDDLDTLGRILVGASGGLQVPLEQVAALSVSTGPSMIRDENGRLAGYVYVDVAGRDVGSFVDEAKDAVSRAVALPPGTHLVWSGQVENMTRARQRLGLIVPVTLVLIVFLLYMNTRSAFMTFVVILAVPFSLVGAVWLMVALDYNVSVATWVGMIALMGLDAETGVFMLLFLNLSHQNAAREGQLRNLDDLKEAVVHGAVRRLRPKFMTVATSIVGLLPIMVSMGTGADVMKRIAAPLVGGLVTSFLLELLVYPALFYLWKRRELAGAGPA
ncbi:MAG: CusA/CzcA family heavy metal efflux RND transporter [Acidobacteriota bacterium]